MKNEGKGIEFGLVPSRDLRQSLGINYIPLRNMFIVGDYKSSNSWDVMDCPENLRRKCWTYRLILVIEFWILMEKARRELNWKNIKGFSNFIF